eukprot:scaffold2202_cov136-Isochrysis_galbana.AAC.7
MAQAARARPSLVPCANAGGVHGLAQMREHDRTISVWVSVSPDRRRGRQCKIGEESSAGETGLTGHVSIGALQLASQGRTGSCSPKCSAPSWMQWLVMCDSLLDRSSLTYGTDEVRQTPNRWA